MADFYCQVSGVFATGRPWSTARHITSNQSPAALLVTWQNAWQAAWTDATHGLGAVYPVGTVMNGFVVAQLDANYHETVKVSNAGNNPGTDAAASLPTSISIIASWRANTVGRHDRGRQSLPAPAEDIVVNDKLTTAAQNRFKAAMEAVKAAINADGSTFFVVNRLPLKDGTAPGQKVVLTDVLIRDKVGKQTKRYRKEPSVYV